jgi:hypothetical protein
MKSTMTFLMALATASALSAQNQLSTELRSDYNGTKRDITNAADRMSDVDYSYKPAEGNTRTFGQIIGHIADVQMALCAMAKGEQKRGNAEQTKTSKAELVGALKESFDYCDGVYNALTDASGAEMIKILGRDRSRFGTLNFNVAHNNEMYGQIVVYYRAKGISPPTGR